MHHQCDQAHPQLCAPTHCANLGPPATVPCRRWVRDESKFRTSVKSRTLSPQWEEQFTLIVHDTRFQALTLVLFDSGGWRMGGRGACTALD